MEQTENQVPGLRVVHDDKVIIKPDPRPASTGGGILLPDGFKPQRLRHKGHVVAVGPGRILDNGQRVPMQCKVGDYVLIGDWGHAHVDIADQEYFVVRDTDVFATLVPEGTQQ